MTYSDLWPKPGKPCPPPSLVFEDTSSRCPAARCTRLSIQLINLCLFSFFHMCKSCSKVSKIKLPLLYFYTCINVQYLWAVCKFFYSHKTHKSSQMVHTRPLILLRHFAVCLCVAAVLKLLKMAVGMRALLDTVMQALPQVQCDPVQSPSSGRLPFSSLNFTSKRCFLFGLPCSPVFHPTELLSISLFALGGGRKV